MVARERRAEANKAYHLHILVAWTFKSVFFCGGGGETNSCFKKQIIKDKEKRERSLRNRLHHVLSDASPQLFIPFILLAEKNVKINLDKTDITFLLFCHNSCKQKLLCYLVWQWLSESWRFCGGVKRDKQMGLLF